MTKHPTQLATLAERFERNPLRHPHIGWTDVEKTLKAHRNALRILQKMEESGGEPDVVQFDPTNAGLIFVDCSPETPRGRVSLCYDRAGLESRKDHPPRTSAMDLASEIGIELLSETEYLTLQSLGEFDLKTSSWLRTPDAVRQKGGALYAERRYGRVFIGHNGAQSYYNSRGFRGSLRV